MRKVFLLSYDLENSLRSPMCEPVVGDLCADMQTVHCRVTFTLMLQRKYSVHCVSRLKRQRTKDLSCCYTKLQYCNTVCVVYILPKMPI